MRHSDGTFFRAIEPNCSCAAVRIEECNRDHVTIQVRIAVFVMFHIVSTPRLLP